MGTSRLPSPRRVIDKRARPPPPQPREGGFWRQALPPLQRTPRRVFGAATHHRAPGRIPPSLPVAAAARIEEELWPHRAWPAVAESHTLARRDLFRGAIVAYAQSRASCQSFLPTLVDSSSRPAVTGASCRGSRLSEALSSIAHPRTSPAPLGILEGGDTEGGSGQ